MSLLRASRRPSDGSLHGGPNIIATGPTAGSVPAAAAAHSVGRQEGAIAAGGMSDDQAVADYVEVTGEWGEEDAIQQRRLEIRNKYAERRMQRKIETYFKALDRVKEQEYQEAEMRRRTVTFTVNYATHFGQELYFVGSCPELGSWNPQQAVRMAWSEGNKWTCVVQFGPDVDEVFYKYITKDSADNVTWEWEGNHHIAVAGLTGGHVVSDVWGTGDQPVA